ncbi:pseudouridine synthase [Deinococcus petrolearius]|uniref:Pseudouridine synthase n=1 Tax=Deinococcus petrolearius TaxID=1751295 RepID=A0ABW1DF17_9DEIO
MAPNAGYAYRSRAQRGGLSVLAYLAATFRHSAADVWAQRLAAGEVEVDGRRAAGDEVLRPGQEVVWHRPPWQEPAAPLDFGVHFEDASLLAVTKPPGLPTLPGGGFYEHTLLHQVRARFPGASPLHRLGRGTSGLVLFARGGAAGAALSAAWRERGVGKTYLALVAGRPAWNTLEITAPIGPVAHPRLGEVYAASPAGKPAHSAARVLERRRRAGGGGETLLAVDIHTGRPHQIRIHTAWAGFPLVGDPLYAPGGGPLPELPGLPGDGGYLLHAWRLGFRHPVSGERLTLEAPPPPGLRPPPTG